MKDVIRWQKLTLLSSCTSYIPSRNVFFTWLHCTCKRLAEFWHTRFLLA